MTRDELRSLIGGYATGSLSAAERKALFEAALDDQELFDELAGEQALKELLDGPGVKARMLAALAPRPRPMWARVWVWAAAGSFAVAVIAGIVLLKTPPQQEKTLEIAQVTAPVPPPAAAVAASPAVPAAVAPPPAVPAPALKKTPPPAEPAAPVATQEAVTATAEASLLKTESAPAAPAAQAAQAGAQSNQDSVAIAPERAFGGVPAAAGRGGRGGGGGGGGGNLGANRIIASPQAAVAPVRFAFDYSITPEGALRIVPASNGFLSVGANNGSTLSTLFNSRPIQAGFVTEVPLPADCVSALVIFSAREMPASFQNVTSPPDAPSGSKSDPNPTPDSVLIAMVPVKR